MSLDKAVDRLMEENTVQAKRIEELENQLNSAVLQVISDSNKAQQEAAKRIKELEAYLLEFGDHKTGCLAIATNNKMYCRCGYEQAQKGGD